MKNKAILSRLAWKIITNPNKLWANLLAVGVFGGARRVVSRTWANVQRGWNDTSDAYKWIARKENNINFFNDSWIPNLLSIRHYIEGPLLEEESNLKVNAFLTNNRWNLTGTFIVILDNIKDAIRDTNLNLNGSQEDKRVWRLTANGMFSPSTAYSHIQSKGANKERYAKISLFSIIWKAKVPNKIKTFHWILAHRKT